MEMLMRTELKERLQAIIDGIDGITERRRSVRKRMIELEKVKDFSEWEVDYERQFERNCIVITEQLHKDAKSMNVIEYHTCMSILDDRVKEQEKRQRKIKK